MSRRSRGSENNETLVTLLGRITPIVNETTILASLCLGIAAIAMSTVNIESPKKSPNKVPAMSSPQETPPDPAAVQECYRRLLTNIQPSIDSGLKITRFSNHGYYPMAQALTADWQTECRATLAIKAMRVKKAPRGR